MYRFKNECIAVILSNPTPNEKMTKIEKKGDFITFFCHFSSGIYTYDSNIIHMISWTQICVIYMILNKNVEEFMITCETSYSLFIQESFVPCNLLA